MIVGVGVDLVDVSRFKEMLARTPRTAERLFTESERSLPLLSMASTFAAKEAVAKALGAPGGLEWHDVEVIRADSGRPTLLVSGTVAQAAERRGIVTWHVSLSHDAGQAIAMVVAEG